MPRETSTAAQIRSSMTVPPDVVVGLLGSADENLRALEANLSAEVHVRGNAVNLFGSSAEVALAERVISELIAVVAGGQALSPDAVRRSIAMVSGEDNTSPAEVLTLDILSRRGKTIRPKTLNQKRYVDAIDANTIVFGIGPAGTGKTYLAMALAVRALMEKQVKRIILTRPAVEAGERLGFLPGSME
ncbi:MAG: PhoH family protein, partial [Mycobacterium sp.]